MSFRKRNDLLATGGDSTGSMGGSSFSMKKTPLTNNILPSRGAVPNRAPLGRAPLGRDLGRAPPGRGPAGRASTSAMGSHQPAPHTDKITQGVENLSLQQQQQQTLSTHPGVKPSSIITTQQVTSTGCSGLDRTLMHGGLPLNHSLLIQETGDSTDFNSVLGKLFASQSVQYNKIQPKSTHLIVLTKNQHFASDLPGLYKTSSRKEMKKLKVSEHESKLTVQNLIDQTGRTPKDQPQASKDLKIAWRYGLQGNPSTSSLSTGSSVDYTDENYVKKFDITTTMVPAPSKEDISIISPLNVTACISKIKETIARHPNKLIRILLPNFLHPALYPPSYYEISNIMQMVTNLNTIVKTSTFPVVLMTSISTVLFKDQCPLIVQLMNQFHDAIVELEPFPQEMLDYLEVCYKAQGQPNKVQHGLLNVYKIPILSDARGEMHIKKSELCFRNGKKGLDVEEWSIPVDESETKNNEEASNPSSSIMSSQGSSCSSSAGHDHAAHSHSNETPAKNTKIDLDF
ncbi:hypothetical protein ACO0RG_002805 [Hanseniaspora osmophila]